MKSSLKITSYALIAGLFFLTGCSSYFTKRNCEKINWFEHGKKVALSGKWLNSDSTVKDCRKVEAEVQESELDKGFKSGVAEYCTIKNAELKGRLGESFSEDLCAGPSLSSLTKSYNKGLNFYCSKENAYEAGTSGKKYTNNCPAQMEKSFLEQYKKGRLVWVQHNIKNKEKDLVDTEANLLQHTSNLNQMTREYSMLEGRKSDLELHKNIALGNRQSTSAALYENQLSQVISDMTAKKSEMNSLQNRINTLISNQDSLKKEINSLKGELPQLTSKDGQ